jgi:hypothetical protein
MTLAFILPQYEGHNNTANQQVVEKSLAFHLLILTANDV